MKVIRSVIIGLGKVGLFGHIPAMHKTGSFALAAVVTNSKERWHEASKTFPGTLHYPSLDELLSQEILDPNDFNLAVISTPPDIHLSQAIKLIEAGYHIMLEKPVTMTAGEAKQIKNLADRHNRSLFAFHSRVYDSDFLGVQEIIATGKLGEPFHIELRWFESFGDKWGNYGFSNWRIANESGGMLYDVGSHALAQIIKLYPEGIASVSAHLQKRGNLKKVDDHSILQLISTSGRIAVVELSNLVPAAVARWLVIGDQATLQSDGAHWTGTEHYSLTPNDPQRSVQRICIQSRGLHKDLYYQDLVQQILGDGEVSFSFDDAIQVMQLIDAAQQSSATGKTVTLTG